MSGKTFISYTRSDQVFARRLYDDLRSAGIDVWLDQNDIKPGEPWDESVAAALKESTAFIVILTPESVASRSVLDEISYALSEKKRVVPVLLRDCEIPYRIARLHYTDFQAHHASALKHLVSTLSFPISGPIEEDGGGSGVIRPGFGGSGPESSRINAQRKFLYVFAVVGAVVLVASAYPAYNSYLAHRKDLPKPDPVSKREPSVERNEYTDKLREVKDWKTQLIGSPLLNNCMGYKPCVDRKAYADQLRAVKDWKTQLIESPLLNDCMGYNPCVERKEYADKLREVKDWKTQLIDSPLLDDCMGYKPCVERKDNANSILSIKDWSGMSFDAPILKDCMGSQQCLAAAKDASLIQTFDFQKIARRDPLRNHCFGWSPCLSQFPAEKHPPSASCGPFTQENVPNCCASLGKCKDDCLKWKNDPRRGIADNCLNR